jgi:glycopeptide antibiotics resistance protein
VTYGSPTSTHAPTTAAPSASAFGWLALGVAIFIVYGSWVPFNFTSRPLNDVTGAFRWALENRSGIQSRSDYAANVLLGIPLGFCLLAWRQLDRPTSSVTFAFSCAVLLPFAILLAIGVEFGQLYLPGRTCSGSDIIAQTLGAACGMAAFCAGGQALIENIRGQRSAWANLGPVGGWCVIYATVLIMVQLLPLDLSASPADWVRKFRTGRVTLSPFADLTNWRKTQSLVELVATYFPLGLLVAFLRIRPSIVTVLLGGLAFSVGIEAAQLLVMSRSPSVTDAIIGGLTVAAGCVVGRVFTRSLELDSVLIFTQGWLLLLILAAWMPLDFVRTLAADRLGSMNWIPFAAATEKNYLSSLEETLLKVLQFGPFGAIVAAYGRPNPNVGRTLCAIFVASGLGSLIEAGQLFLPDRVAGPTDVLLAALGGWMGCWLATRVRLTTTMGVPIVTRLEAERLPFPPLSSPTFTPPPVATLTPPDDRPINIRMPER